VEDGRARGIVTEGDRIDSDAVLLAAGAWTSELVASFGMQLRVEPRRSQMIALAHVPPVRPSLEVSEFLPDRFLSRPER